MLLALITAAVLRFWQLDQVPPGLYRDEAFNGLDALEVLAGDHALYFQANNGREPIYIYLTALAVSLFGQTTFAVRAGAAFAGTLSTVPIYLLGKSWFGRRTGILAAWIWAITFWPVHLSRIGLRTILIVPVMSITFWLATEAYRRQKGWLWWLSGLIYGLGFYTYLAFRFTPLLLLLIALFLIIIGRGRRLWPGALWFAAGSLISMLPLLLLVVQQPELVIGRTGQVSILNPDVYEESVVKTLAANTWAALAMFLLRGDSILRHNLANRPVFDPLMVAPFLIGLFWSLRHWRRPPSMAVLLWLTVMLGPTILAADTPHFLRASGVLPAAVLLPAIGLDWIWRWPRLPSWVGAPLVSLVLIGSLIWTVYDYAGEPQEAYAHDPQVAYAFEAAATELAADLLAQPSQTAVYLDDRLWTSWPSLSFLVGDDSHVVRYLSAGDLPDRVEAPAAIYAWPYESLDFLPVLLQPPVLLTVQDGPLTRGDFEQEAYPLYVRYGVETVAAFDPQRRANFADRVYLHEAAVAQLDPNTLQVAIYWESDQAIEEDLSVFIHVAGPEGLVGQSDAPLAGGRWPGAWWQPGLIVRESHVVALSEPFDSGKHKVSLGLYRSADGERLPVADSAGEKADTAWTIDVE